MSNNKEINYKTIVNYDPCMIMYKKEDSPYIWSYNIVLMNDNSEFIKQENNEKKSINVIIPLASSIKPLDVKNRIITGAESFSTRVGFDFETNIYGIRFNIINPSNNFNISFKTISNQGDEQLVGIIKDNQIYNNQMIYSPAGNMQSINSITFANKISKFWGKCVKIWYKLLDFVSK